MDVYIEELMPKQKDKNDWIILIGIIAAGVLLTGLIIWFMILMALKNNIATQFVLSLGPLAIAGVWYGVYSVCSLRSVEYEYTVINNSIDIDKIMAKKNRKRLISIDIKNATLMAKVDDTEANGVLFNPPSRVKIYDYSALDKRMDTYFVDCMADGERCIVLFQPTGKMVESLWKYNPKAVKRYNA